MIIERLSREHRNIEKLLAILERELEVFHRGDRPDYEVIGAVISYFEVYPEVYHHPQEDLVFAKLRTRDPVAAAKVGDLAREHHKGAERLRRVAHAVENVLADREVLRQNVDTIVRDFIVHERRPHYDGRSRFLSCRAQGPRASRLDGDRFGRNRS
jgi:hemerythrin-like domain-containing protein